MSADNVKPLEDEGRSAAMLPLQARARIVAAANLADDAVLLARLLDLGTREELRRELRQVVDHDAPSPPGRWHRVLALGVLDALAGRRRS